MLDPDGDGALFGQDCDDTRADVYPGATEVCDGLDNDCDDAIDDGATSVFYCDADEDGHGDPGVSVSDCEAPDGYVADATDCDDRDDRMSPLGIECRAARSGSPWLAPGSTAT